MNTAKMDHGALRAVKQALRKSMRAKLAILPKDLVVKETQAVVNRLFAMPEYQRSRSISVYISMSTGEISTSAIIEDILGNNKRCYIPRCDGETMDMVRLTSLEDFRSLPLNKWQIPEPLLTEARENALDQDGLDLIIVPGLAFDKNGWRLGHGKGFGLFPRGDRYYDRYFAKVAEWSALSGRPLPVTIALSLSAQMVDGHVPREDFDQKPHFLLTPTGVIH
ncbi:hypothetical protein HDU87_007622 [Geranomyces variabilis]|uniref:5-formyltetrahydrofolate cyclo-ligase n=1 Tax=Geranomyces variabilis TaxID=109894 RepID=A0AAD5TE65_9FUNG|nr:hypothetical protein HDU87_007622 [Geranomyces variabilis]